MTQTYTNQQQKNGDVKVTTINGCHFDIFGSVFLGCLEFHFLWYAHKKKPKSIFLFGIHLASKNDEHFLSKFSLQFLVVVMRCREIYLKYIQRWKHGTINTNSEIIKNQQLNNECVYFEVKDRWKIMNISAGDFWECEKKYCLLRDFKWMLIFHSNSKIEWSLGDFVIIKKCFDQRSNVRTRRPFSKLLH